jgi:hypothetical protein
MVRLDITGLPALPSEAAGEFYKEWMEKASGAGATLTVVFPPADHTHTGWRLAAIQTLAREAAPLRINAIASDDPAAIDAALAYLEGAEGLTGQYLQLDSAGAGAVLNPVP